ncbi:hypothetical protein MHYP_G00160630 [Metynnis hypsauchen]
MNCLEKRHVSHKANMQHLGYLDSFMDETDREVMNLTDRAFKSLCIGDEAIYNDSEFSPSPVSCHKPLAEEMPKKTLEDSSLAVKKLGAHPLNGVHKSTSLFAAFMAKKNGDTTKTTNGDSWDKSALLSIQRELSDFSSDFQISQVKNHLNPSEQSNKSSKDTTTQSGKSVKGKHSKSSKLKKLNSKNFFLHSEFSPFQSWRDLNKFPFGLENMEIFQSKGPPEWYDSPLYKKLTMSHRSHVPESNKEETCQNTSLPAIQVKPEAEVSQQPAQTLTTVPLKAEIQTKTQPQVLLPSSGSEQRCQSEGDHCAPWRKNRNRAKSAVPIGQALMSSRACEQTKAGDEGVLLNKKEVRTMEEQASSSSTPFSILHLLTPVIPSRQGTGSSEVLQSVFSPSTLDLPPLPETEIRPSPEIKREGYKSMASSLLFNLKDNRKRVKAMYSPPRFKGLDSADQSKLSPLIEQVITKSAQDVPENPEAEIPSPVHQKVHASPMRLLLERADQPNSQGGHINGHLPDDFLALSLLQAGNRGSPIKLLKSNKSRAVKKPTYPSLNMYRKASPDIKTMGDLDFHPATDKNTKQGQSLADTPQKDGKELPRKSSMITPATHRNNTDSTSEGTHINYAKTKRTAGEVQTENVEKEKYPLAVVRKHNARSDALTHSGSRNQDKQNMGEMKMVEQKPVKDQECSRKDPKHKHSFSARQNNYIKNQRCMSTDDKGEDGYGGEGVASAVAKENNGDALVRKSGSSNVREKRKSKKNVGVHKAKEIVDGKPDGLGESAKKDDFSIKDYTNVVATYREQRMAKNDAQSMKGNTSAKRALFATKEQILTKTAAALKKESMVMDKYELAKVALEEVIAEREHRKKESQIILSTSEGDVEGQQALILQEDYKQVNMSAVSQKETVEGVTGDRRGGHKGISDCKHRSQIVQRMSERDTKHDESHVVEVNLARPCKQEDAAKYSQHADGQIKYSERERSGRHRRQSETDNVKPLDKVTEHNQKDPEPKNTSLVKESTRDSNTDSNTRQGEESYVQEKSTSSRPEVPPRRGRANSQCEEGLVFETAGKEAETSVKNEESISSEDKEVKANFPKDRGPIKGHVSALKKRFDVERGVQSINIQDGLTQAEGPKDDPKMDQIKQKVLDVSESAPAFENALTRHNLEGAGRSLEKEPVKNSKLPERTDRNTDRKFDYVQDFENIGRDIMEKKDVNKKESGFALEVLQEPYANQNQSKDHNTSSVKELSSGPIGKSNAEKIKPDSESQKDVPAKTPKTSGSVKNDAAMLDSIIVYDILNQPESPVDVTDLDQGNKLSNSSKESPFSQKAEEFQSQQKDTSTRQASKSEENLGQTSEPCISDRVVSLPTDVAKGGWVRSLIESARNLSPACQSNPSSPTMGKPALFKVKDNKFSASPVTKTVRPVLHKTVSEICQPWSPRGSLSGSEKGEDVFKDCIELQSPTVLSPTPPSTPARSPQPNQLSMLPLLPPTSQFTTDRKEMDSLTVPDEDEKRSAVSSVSEGMESCGTSTGDTVEETLSSTAPAEDTEGSKAPSERSESVCSGTDNQSLSKPPAVPPKTEKALHRAMKLTTRRIQKAESKSKLERKGRSSEKSANHKPERRHHSSDGRSDHRVHSIDQSPGENSNDKLLSKTHRSERHARQESHSKEKDASSRQHGNQIRNLQDAKNYISEEPTDVESKHKGQLDVQRNVDADFERPGRTGVKYLSHKLDRRAQSLDRFLSDKPELSPVSRMNDASSKNVRASKRAPLRQNSLEHAYPSTNIVAQSFPMTQRKLLQDPDSGQYFVVDMPVQVKTKTFFDPETGSYVQLPVQSPESSVPKAQSMEVVNAPSLVLYHGFVPMSVSSLPAQKSTVNLASIVTPNNSEVFESEIERHEDIYQKHKAVGRPYLEPAHVSQKHLAEDGIDGVS